MKIFNAWIVRFKQRRSDYVNQQFINNFSTCETTWSNLLFVCRVLTINDFHSYNVSKGQYIYLNTPYRNVTEFFEHLDMMITASTYESFSSIRFRELQVTRKSLTEFLLDDDLMIVNIYKTKERLSQKIVTLMNVLDALTDPFMINYQNRNLTNILHAARAVLEALLQARELNDIESPKQKAGQKD